MANYIPKSSFRDQYNPLRGLTMARIVSMEESAERGDNADLQWFWSHMADTDVTVASAIAKRIGLISALDWEIRYMETADPVLAAEQAQVLQYAYNRIENLTEAARDIAMGNFTGYSILEKIRTGYGSLIQRLEYIPCHFWNYNKETGRWLFNERAQAGLNHGEPVNTADLIIHQPNTRLFKSIGRHFFAKQLALADWDTALENGANQSIVVVGPPGTTPEKELEYQGLAEAITSNLRGYVPHGTDIKVTDLSARESLPYFARVEYSDRQIVMAATGGMLTMLTESGSGTLAGNAHSESLMQLARADAAEISETFQKQIDREILKSFFPNDPVSVYFKYDIPQAPQTLAQITEAASAFSWSGYRIKQAQLEEKTGFQLEQIAPPGA